MSLAAAFALTLSAVRLAPAQDVNAAVDKAVNRYATLKTVRGTLHHTVRNIILGKTTASTAEFQQEFPNKMSVRFKDAAGEAIVSDGVSVWSYLPSSRPGRVTKCALSDTPAAGVGLIGLFVSSPRAKYNLADAGRDTVSGRATRAVALAPKQEMEEFTKATVWIDEQSGLIWQFETTERTGLVRRVRFETIEVNATVDQRLFTFAAPSGVRVVGCSASTFM